MSPELGQNILVYYLIIFVLGTCVGSFLNVIALRSLKEESFVWPASYCPHCQKNILIRDNIPIISYLFLRGKCRFCQTQISWQYPVVEFITGIVFVFIAKQFLFGFIPYIDSANNTMWSNIALGIQNIASGREVIDMPWQQKIALSIGMTFLACTLIATSITDLREKLIPHEITYPSMLIGICFSTFVRHDVLGALAGIGISYILFDFLAYYGLKIYMHFNKDVDNEVEDGQPHQTPDNEPLEVMGGGDAVLSAVIASYLGWQLLAIVLTVGFLFGTLMGLILLVHEIKKASLASQLIGKIRQLSALFLLGFGILGFVFDQLMKNFAQSSTSCHLALLFAMAGGIAGCLIAIVQVGSQVSKPFPFGPALSIGGFVAMFLIPTWIAFH
jgi:leader peptidase (prepilin peptidase)/N-methyltransferase